MIYSKELRKQMLENRISKLEKNFENQKIVAKLRRRLKILNSAD